MHCQQGGTLILGEPCHQPGNTRLTQLAMGEPGRITRLATLYLGATMTYAALDKHQATAPGQLSVTHLRSLITLFEQRS